MDELKRFEASLRSFMVQHEHDTLVLSCTSQDLLIPGKVLRGQAQQERNLIVLGLGICDTVAGWTDELAKSVNADLQLFDAHLKQPAGTNALPLDALDTRLPASQRIELMVRHCSALLTDGELVVWALLPTMCRDVPGYLEAVSGLLEHQPWMLGHRFIIWDDAKSPLLVPQLLGQENQDCMVLDLDLSPAKQLDTLVQKFTDPKTPVAARSDAAFELAAVDFSYKRYDEALAKFRWIFAQDQGQNPHRQALCLLGAADVYWAKQEPEQALKFYQSALGTSLATKNPQPVMVQPILMGAGRASLQLGDFQSAEGYFDYAERSAAKNMNAYMKADALELRGQAQQTAFLAGHPEKEREALASYSACRTVCLHNDYEDRWRKVSQRELDFLQSQGNSKKAPELRKALDAGFVSEQVRLGIIKEGEQA